MKLEITSFGFPIIRLDKSESAIIISDAHIGLSKKSKNAKCNLKDLYSFLKALHNNKLDCEKELKQPSLFVLLGDFLDFWQGDINTILCDFYSIAKVLLSLNFLKLYVAGNHDRIIGRVILKDIEGKNDFLIMPEMAVLESGGKRFALIHGHQFDSLFIKLRGLWQIESYIYSLAEGFMSLPGRSEWYLAGFSALSGLLLLIYSELLRKIPGFIRPFVYVAPLLLMLPLLIMTIRKIQDELWYLFVLPLSQSLNLQRTKFKHLKEISKKVILDWLKANKDLIGEANGIIFGHTHVPGIAVTNGYVFANSGSWLTEKYKRGISNTFIYVENGEIYLFQYKNGKCLLLEKA